MKKAVIWDLDGTLFDSYHVIVESLYSSFADFGVRMDREAIWKHAISYSSNSLVEKVSAEFGLSAQLILQRYAVHSGQRYMDIKPMPHAIEVLEALRERGIEHYVFTHRGRTTEPVLKNLGMEKYFQEVLTSQSGFPRKPDPAAICYLMEKHGLPADTTYYCGDRSIDMQCGKNAGIRTILFLLEGSHGAPSGAEDYIAHDLRDILNIV